MTFPSMSTFYGLPHGTEPFPDAPSMSRTKPAGNLLPLMPKEFVEHMQELMKKLNKEIDESDGR